MRLYLARHGKAENGPEEADRHLSDRGRNDVEAVAKHLGAQSIKIDRVLHSGLARARETAEILAAQLAPGVSLVEMPGIEPWGDILAFAKAVEKWDEDTLVCGHEPFMGEVTSLLIAGDALAGSVEVKTGTVLALERDKDTPGWQLRWMVTPRIVRGLKTEDQE